MYELKAMLSQYAVLRCAPAAAAVWDELHTLGYAIGSSDAKHLFEAMRGWITLHQRVSSEASTAAAEGLLKKAIVTFDDLAVEQVNGGILEAYFLVITEAHAYDVFEAAVKTIYGFDVNFPTMLPPAAVNGHDVRPLDSNAIKWILKMYARKGDLSRMVATVETYDGALSGERETVTGAAYFTSSFTAADAQVRTKEEEEKKESTRKPLIEGVHFVQIVEAALEQNNKVLARHYMMGLSSRWLHVKRSALDLLAERAGTTKQELLESTRVQNFFFGTLFYNLTLWV
jgi:hypothetical protein